MLEGVRGLEIGGFCAAERQGTGVFSWVDASVRIEL